MLQSLSELDARAKLVVIGTFLTSLAVFVSIPFLSVILLDYPGMTPTKIGVIIGVSHLCSMLFGLVGGNVADRIGRSKVLTLSLFGFVLVFAGFAVARTPLHFFILNGLNGLCQSLFRPASEAFLSDVTRPEQRAKVFNYRYTAGNLGYTVAPLLGGLLTQLSRGISFMASAAIFLAYWIVFVAVLLRDKQTGAASKPSIPFGDVLGILRKDSLMIIHIIGGVLVTLCFSQVTSTFAQFAKLEINNGVWLYSTVLTVNTVLVLVLQAPMNRLTKSLGPMKQIMAGCLLYVVGFVLMGMAKISPALALAGIVVITSGEVIIVPTGSTLVDAIAPADLKAAYFGAAQLRYAGMFIGPILGGFMYEILGGGLSFLIIGGLSFAAAMIYLYGSRASAPIPKYGEA
ncbi:MFS transporter [Sorangium sp. So ce429]